MMRMGLLAAAFAFALSGGAAAQNLSLRAPPWAQPLLATDVIATTGGRAVLAVSELGFAARVTIAPLQGGVARVIRFETREDGAILAVRRFTGHPSTGWWLWGPDTPRITPAEAEIREEVQRLVQETMAEAAMTAAPQEGVCRGEQAFIEVAVGARTTSAVRACVSAADAAGRLALRLSDLAGSQTEEELAAAAIEEVLQADRDFAAMAAAEGVPAAFERYAAIDAIMLRSEGEPTAGREAIAGRFATWPEGAQLEWTPRHARVSTRGDMAWTWGDSVYVAPDGARDAGRYISVWKRDDEGAWRFAFDAGVE
ncbi:MAG: DUF4440 domain-containing protein [Hyphomonadaceae bacterium]